jgi:hypothetical protein
VVEEHSRKTLVAVILAVGVSLSVVVLSCAVSYVMITDPAVNDMGTNSTTVLGAILSSAITGLVGFISYQQSTARAARPDEIPGDEDLVLDVNEPL